MLAVFFSEEEVKKKWKSFRDNFRVELKKQQSQPKSGSSSSVLLKRKWIYFDQLLFLRDVMDPAPMTGSLDRLPNTSAVAQDEVASLPPTANEESINNELEEPLLEAGSAVVDEDVSQAAATPSYNRPGRSTKRNRTERDDFLKIERQKLELLKSSSDLKLDGDYNFLVSFLPIMKKMSDIQKLEFRVKMSELALNICRDNSSTPSTSWSSNEPQVRNVEQQEQVPENVFSYFVEDI